MSQVKKRGDCLGACIATILGLPLDEVPRFIELDSEEERVEKYLDFMNHHNIQPLTISLEEMSEEVQQSWLDHCGDSLVFVIGKSPRGDWDHNVIYKNGKLWHDPNPAGGGVENVKFLELHLPIQATEQAEG